MSNPKAPAICRLVEHNEGPVSLSRRLGGKPVYQEIQRWVARGWASPMHILALKPLAPPGVTIEDLYADRNRLRRAAPKTRTATNKAA